MNFVHRWGCGLGFNTQPPEGGWKIIPNLPIPEGVSTHSRPKAAGQEEAGWRVECRVSTHSRPKAAGRKE